MKNIFILIIFFFLFVPQAFAVVNGSQYIIQGEQFTAVSSNASTTVIGAFDASTGQYVSDCGGCTQWTFNGLDFGTLGQYIQFLAFNNPTQPINTNDVYTLKQDSGFVGESNYPHHKIVVTIPNPPTELQFPYDLQFSIIFFVLFTTFIVTLITTYVIFSNVYKSKV